MPLTSELVCLAYKQSSLKMGLPASAHALLNGTTPDPCPNGVARAPQESDHFYTAATSQNGTPSIPLTHLNTPNSPNTQIGSHNPRKRRKKLLHIKRELQTPTINPLASNCGGGSIWKYRETSVKKLAQETTAKRAINAVHYYDFGITLIDAWRIFPAKR
eukprot:1142374-Pelagomonas_calceolata.AAC.1